MSRDTMRAIVWHGPGQLAYEKVRVPTPGPHEALIEVRYNGLCTTDYEIIAGNVDGAVPPMIVGHEPLGVVVAVGDQVAELGVGQRVVLDTMLGCGLCPACRMGHTELCCDSQEIGFSAPGTWSDFAAVPAANLHAVPDTIGDVEATLIEALTCQMGGISALNVAMGESVAIIGSGLAALLFVQLARLRGTSYVAVAMRDYPPRIALAREFGADQIVVDDPVEALISSGSMRRGGGFDNVIDAVGSPQTVLDAIRLARRGGRVLLYGLHSVTVDGFRLADCIFHNLTLYGRTSAPWMWGSAIDLVGRGDIQLSPLVSEVVRFEEVAGIFQAPRPHGGPIKRVIRIRG
jgi:L-iditol 2-dehydrogenase